MLLSTGVNPQVGFMFLKHRCGKFTDLKPFLIACMC